MKKYNYSVLLLVIFAFLGSSCVEDLPTKYDFTGYQFSNLDANAGQWKLILHSSNEQIPLPIPAASGSPELLKELAEAKEMQSKATSIQREAVAYWTNNPLLRWNEIALELATKYNLIPAPNPDGTYPVPDPANPSNYPKFPYSHPPYTSRMLAHLSVAQYDGLIMAWHYKYKFKRQAPYQLDTQIKSAYENNGLFSYPSDGAVVATASRDILTAMFPLEKEFLAQKAQEHLESLIVAGINVSSDVEAGKLIGAAVAKTALTRASTDGMKNAQTNRAKSDSIKNAAKERFGWVWENQETPQRMVGLVPLFSKVRLWNVPNVEAIRPGPPPAPGSPAFEASAKELKQYAAKVLATNRYLSTTLVVILSILLLASGEFETLWPIFGSANQLLAALALLTIGVWLIKKNISATFVTIPMFFMFTVTLASLGLFAFKNFEDGGYVLAAIAALLFVLAIALIILAVKSLKKEAKLSEKTS